MRAKILITFLLLLAVFITPDLSLAQESTPLVAQCEGRTCSACDLADLANNVIKWLIGIMFLLFAIITVVAGFGLVTSGGNTSALQDAKKKLTNGIIGIVIVLAAWLLVDTMMRGLLGDNGTVRGNLLWSEIECGVQVEARIVEGLYAAIAYEVAPPSANDTYIPVGVAPGSSGLDTEKAIRHLVANAENKSISMCLRYVSEAINAGKSSFATRGVASAKDAGPKLVQNGFREVYSGGYVPGTTDQNFSARPGDVAVFQPGCTRSRHGHIAMYTGRQWVSDFRQNYMGPNGSGRCPVKIYRP